MINLFENLNFVASDGERFAVFAEGELRDRIREIPGARSKGKSFLVPGTSDHTLALSGLPLTWSAEAEFDRYAIERREAKLTELSKSKGVDYHLPGFGKPPKRFQNAGIQYIITQKRVLLCDEPGLGKTIQGLGALFATCSYPGLVICLKSNMYTWAEEISACIPGKKVCVAFKDTPEIDILMADVVVTSYTQLTGWRTWKDSDGKSRRSAFTDHTEREAVPSALASTLMKAKLKMILVDEGHKIKEGGNATSMVVNALRHGVPYRVVITGTPMPNRASELVNQLTFLDRLDDLGGWFHFMKYYCGFKKGRFGMEAKKSLHAKELHDRLRRICYIRRKKCDVAEELGPKTRTAYPIDIDNREEYEFAEAEIVAWAVKQVRKNEAFMASIAHLPAGDQERAIRVREFEKADAAERNEALVRMSALKEIIGRGKLSATYEWIDNFLESGEKLVVFAQHKKILQALLKRYPRAARVISEDDSEERFENVRRFQNDPDCRLIILAMGTSVSSSPGGVAWTLTAASNVLTIQLGWNSAHHDQCEDRCHRIGTVDNVTCHYIIGRDTFDIDNVEIIESKRQACAQVVDGEEASSEDPIIDEIIKRLARRAA